MGWIRPWLSFVVPFIWFHSLCSLHPLNSQHKEPSEAKRLGRVEVEQRKPTGTVDWNVKNQLLFHSTFAYILFISHERKRMGKNEME